MGVGEKPTLYKGLKAPLFFVNNVYRLKGTRNRSIILLGKWFLKWGKLMMKEENNRGFIFTTIFLLIVIAAGLTYIGVSRRQDMQVHHAGSPEEILDKLESEKQARLEARVSEYVKASRNELVKGASVADIAEKAGPSIAGIKMSIAGNGTPLGIPFGELKAEGSGIIISEDGYILTNYHVVSFADPEGPFSRNTLLEVFLPDGREARAQFIGGYQRNDIAVIKIGMADLPVAELGDSSLLRIGERVVAIGNPLGMEFAGSVTVGYVSALNRTITIGDTYLELIQTDAAINPGNSGGALVNSRGQVIGINTVKIAVQGVEGLGFAIPVNDAWEIARQLIAYGTVRDRASLGFRGTVVSKAFAEMFDTTPGIFVLETTPGGSAEAAGIRNGDIIIRIGSVRTESMGNIFKVEKDYKSGDMVNVTLVRGDETITVELKFIQSDD